MTVEKWLEKAEKHGEYHADLKRACQIIRRQQGALKKMAGGSGPWEAFREISTEALSDCDAIVEGK